MLSKILQYSSLGLTSVSVLFFPISEGTKMAESEVPFVSNVSTGLSVVGGLSALIGFLNQRKEHALIKWVAIPLVLVHVAVLAVLFGCLAAGSFSKFKAVGTKVMGYVSPVLNFGLGGYVIYEMISNCEKEFNIQNTGTLIHKIPAILSYPPMNKHPFYLIVIFIRTGGLITKFSGGIIDTVQKKIE